MQFHVIMVPAKGNLFTLNICKFYSTHTPVGPTQAEVTLSWLNKVKFFCLGRHFLSAGLVQEEKVWRAFLSALRIKDPGEQSYGSDGGLILWQRNHCFFSLAVLSGLGRKKGGGAFSGSLSSTVR